KRVVGARAGEKYGANVSDFHDFDFESFDRASSNSDCKNQGNWCESGWDKVSVFSCRAIVRERIELSPLDKLHLCLRRSSALGRAIVAQVEKGRNNPACVWRLRHYASPDREVFLRGNSLSARQDAYCREKAHVRRPL